MPPKPQTVSTVVAILAALLLGAILGVTRLQSGDAAPGTVPGTGLMRLGSSWGLASNYDKYSYVFVGRGSAAAAASQPGMSLIYHSGTSVNVNWDTGVPATVAAANGWLLKDASGNLLRSVSYPDNYIGDVGSSAYQAEWARRVGDYVVSVGADGVYIDDVIADVATLSGVYPAKYPNQGSWEDAMAAFVAAVGPALKARGLYVVLNAHKFVPGNLGSNDGSLEAQWWQRLGPYVNGLHNEYFMQSSPSSASLRGEGSAWWDNWSGWANLISVAQSTGADFFGMTYGSTADTTAMRYVRATHLLFWDGSGGGILYQNESGDPWSTEWTIDIGTPTGGRFAVGVGWRRAYSGGTVVVNPSTTTSQSFALGGTYLMPDGSAVTSVNLAPKSGLVLRSTTTTPINTAPPTITGTPQQGVLQSSTTGSWSGSPTRYTYQWSRCDTVGGACAEVSGATASEYLLGATDVGKTMRVKVTASNGTGSGSASSPPTSVVVPPPPANLTLPAISGSAQDGKSLSSSPGTWTNSPTSYVYQWQRCDVGGNDCADVAAATTSSFALTSADVGHTLRLVVTVANASGSATATSPATAVVVAASGGGGTSAPVNTALPAVSGTTQQGSTLTASQGSWSNSPTSYTYQWRRCDTGGGSCAAISGAAATTYVLAGADVGQTLRVSVTATNSAGSATAASAATGVVSPSAVKLAVPANTSPPDITGTAQEDNTLSASTGSWANSPASYTYQWRRCDGAGAGCADLGGETGSQHALTSADVGKTLRVVVTATNSAGSGTATSAASSVVAPAPVPPPPTVVAPTNTSLPNVTGPERVDKEAEASRGSWDGDPVTFAYQWLRCETAAENLATCVAIPGATGSSYTFVEDDREHFVIVRVTASNAGGSTSATSKLGHLVRG